ncbi:MAG: (d)CMP kinase [Deltaproteobacteria bacterium]|nr:(d)CMP kinase [Deltaproteobacteria bacterium]
MKPMLITIDGPAGAGKTTVSRSLADRLGYTYVDTGALYRGVAHAALARGIESDDDKRLKSLMEILDLRFKLLGSEPRLFLNGVDITDGIRTPEITMMASAVSARPVVRNALFDLQRRLGDKKAAVFEGRDMGTVVFPDADVKFFLFADIRSRAKRRYEEIKGKGDHTLEQVEADMRVRDENDSTRSVAPLVAADDAVRIDSTALGIDEVIDEMLTHVRLKAS